MGDSTFLSDYISFHQNPISRIWDKGNDVLYNMCKVYPKHNSADEIIAKIWLIGRSYAAAIERRRNKKDSNDSFYVNAANAIKEFEFDKEISRIPDQDKLDEDIVITIAEAHFYVTKKFYQITKLNKRSLASKYLHFHKPIVPIYDSRARQGVSGLFSIYKFLEDPLRKMRYESKEQQNGDREYLKFIKKIFAIQKYLLANNCQYHKVRDIDKYLIEIQERKIRRA